MPLGETAASDTTSISWGGNKWEELNKCKDTPGAMMTIILSLECFVTKKLHNYRFFIIHIEQICLCCFRLCTCKVMPAEQKTPADTILLRLATHVVMILIRECYYWHWYWHLPVNHSLLMLSSCDYVARHVAMVLIRACYCQVMVWHLPVNHSLLILFFLGLAS